jgi:hypothetical protein
MKRLMGVLVVLAAACGVAASAASANARFYECVKTAGGQFMDKACSVKGAAKHPYELQAGIGKGKAFKAKSGAVSIRLPTLSLEMACTGSKSTISLTSTTTYEGMTTWSKCRLLDKVCTSPEAKAGTVVAGLEGRVGVLTEFLNPGVRNAAGDGIGGVSVGLKKWPRHDTQGLAMSCEGITLEVGGDAIGEVTGNVDQLSKLSTWSFARNKEGFQLYRSFEGEPPKQLEVLIEGSPFAASLSMTNANRGENLELKLR